ncbi:tandem-95 repeat protein [Cellulomonas sp. NPDC089187]|uniref:Ig-like domain-containing protein n=1 Tax=Cellulomonas sp. NPDC089187 TaxID=3154970 RepID=UPI003415B08D
MSVTARARSRTIRRMAAVATAALLVLTGSLPIAAMAASDEDAVTAVDSAEAPAGDLAAVDASAAGADSAASTETDGAAPTEEGGPTRRSGAAEREPSADFAVDRAATRAAGTVGTASGLTLAVTQDGTAPWDADDEPGNDSSATNGIVRTHDSVVYLWGYSVAAAGDVTLTQTLPEGMSWVEAESLAACAASSSGVSEDGRTLTCVRQHDSTGASTYQVRAMVDYAVNEQVLSTVLSSAGTADSAPATVTATATPRFMTRATSSPLGYTEWQGQSGFGVDIYPMIYQPVDAARGIRGIEGLGSSFSFDIDVSGLGASAQVASVCRPDGWTWGNGFGGSNTPANSVPGGGEWTCTQSAPGEPVTVTVTGAITDGRSYPTHNLAGAASAADEALVSLGFIRLWIPSDEYTSVENRSVQFVNFDPESATGQSNYGDGYAPNHEPGAALVPNVNGARFSFPLASTVGLAANKVYAATGTITSSSPVAPGATSVVDGNTPMYPGDTLRFGGSIGVRSATAPTAAGLSMCAVWDEDLMSAAGPVDSSVELVAVEYGHVDANTDTERKAADCGSVADGDSTWSSTIEGVTDGPVNAVRWEWIEMANQATPYFGVPLTRTTDTLTTGAVLPVFFQVWGDDVALIRSGFIPELHTGASLGARALAANAQTSVAVTWDAPTSDPGLVRTVTVQPSASVASGASSVAANASLRVTLPSTTPMIAGSWNGDAPVSQVTNADGSVTSTFEIGDLPANQAAPALTFQARLPSATAITMPATIRATAVIESDGDPRAVSFRTGTGDIVINPPATFGITKSATATHAIPGVPVVYTIGWYNGLPGSAGTGKIVDVLPYNGDGRGTEGLNGLTVTGVSVEADMSVDIEYTTEDSVTVMAAVQADRSGDTGVTWQAWPTDGSTPEGVTAVRFVTGEIVGGTGGEAIIEVTPGVLSLNGSIVNDVSGLVTGLDTPVSGAAGLELVSGAAQIAGTVYLDDDYSWAMDGAESGLGDVTVRATGYTFGANQIDEGGAGDDIVVTDADDLSVTTEADGSYVLDGLSPGKWTLAVDPSSAALAGLDAAELPEQPITLAPADAITGVDFGYMDPIDPPVLTDDERRVSAGDSITVDVLTNDTFDVSGAITEVSTPDSGSVTWAEGDTTIGYTAAADGPGDVTFTYTVTDKARQSRTATVTVTVVPLPTAANSTVTIGQEPTAIDLAGLFTGDAATISTTAATTSVSGVTVTYTPADGFAGQDTFTYTVTDSMGKTATATITVVVLQAPDLSDDATSTLTDTPVSVEVTANDAFVGTGTLVVVTGPSHGTAVLDGADVVYTPEEGWTGTDTFTYSVTDVAGQSDTATVTVIVVEAVTATVDTACTGMETAVEIPVLDNDVVTNGGITGTTDPVNGTIVVGTDGVITYTPAADFSGTDTFTYTITDAAGQSATANVTVTVVARPTGEDASVRTGLDTPVSVEMVSTGDALTLAVSGDAAHGTATISGGTVTYTPDAGYVGMDQVELTWTDSVGQTVTVILDVEVVDAPVANDDQVDTLVSAPVTVSVLGNDQGDAVTLTAVGTPMFGTAEVVGDTVVYTPNAGYSGPDSVSYTITDSVGQTATARVIVAVYAAPMPPELTARTGVEMAVVLDPLAQAPQTDALLAPSTVIGVGATAAGEVLLHPDGTITFTPAVNFTGEATFTYDVVDTFGQTATGTVTVTVIALTVTDLTARTPYGTAVTVDALAGATGSAVVVSEVTDGAHGTVVLGADGTVTYTPADGFSGVDTFTVTYVDDLGQVATATVTVTVDPEPVLPPTEPTPSPSSTTVTTTTPRSGVLAWTGSEGLPLAVLAAIAVLGGGWLLYAVRRRRR